MAISRSTTFTSKKRAWFGDEPSTRLFLDSAYPIVMVEVLSTPVTTALAIKTPEEEEAGAGAAPNSMAHVVTVTVPSTEVFIAAYGALNAIKHDSAAGYPERVQAALKPLMNAPEVSEEEIAG